MQYFMCIQLLLQLVIKLIAIYIIIQIRNEEYKIVELSWTKSCGIT